MSIQLKQLLTPQLTFCQHPATSKKALLFNISEAFVHQLNIDVANGNQLFEAFIAREKLGSTGIGHGVAIPHVRCPNIAKPVGALIKLEKGIDFDAVDQKLVDLVFALIVPEQAEDTHLLILAHLAKLFHQANFRNQLRNSQHNTDLHNAAIYYDPISTVAV